MKGLRLRRRKVLLESSRKLLLLLRILLPPQRIIVEGLLSRLLSRLMAMIFEGGGVDLSVCK